VVKERVTSTVERRVKARKLRVDPRLHVRTGRKAGAPAIVTRGPRVPAGRRYRDGGEQRYFDDKEGGAISSAAVLSLFLPVNLCGGL